MKRATPVRGPLHTVALLLGAALPLVLSQSTGWGAPADITQVAAPMLGTDPPKARDVAAGDASVSTQNGTLSYSYPIVVPPGRGGAAPQLALSYSSQAPLYGDIAAGWSLNLPEIKEDTADGRMVAHQQPLLAPGEHHPRWLSSLGGNLQLVSIDEPKHSDVAETFRGHHDASFLRYERLSPGAGATWRVRSPDGSTYLFGEPTHITGNASAVLGVRAPLTSTADAFGNLVDYSYSYDGDEYLLQKVQWGKNAAANLPHFAELVLSWEPAPTCPGGNAEDIPIGAALDYRLGDRWVNGASKLTQLVATAVDPVTNAVEHTRTLALTYDAASESCATTTAPARYLTALQQSASGTGLAPVTLPPVTFAYGPVTQGLAAWDEPSTPNWEAGAHHKATISWGLRFADERWPTVQSMFLDIDGDGLVDRLAMAEGTAPAECVLKWHRNLGGGQFDPTPQTQTLRRLPWAGGNGAAYERCALNYQYANLHNWDDETRLPGAYLVRRFIDLNDDGAPELVSALSVREGWDPVDAADPLDEVAAFGDSWPSCSEAPSCPLLDYDCMDDAYDKLAGEYDLSAVSSCLADATMVPCADMLSAKTQARPGEPQRPGPNREAKPFDLCGRYPWIIFWNQGNGQLATDGDIRLMDRPLESEGGDSSMNGAPFAERHSIMDVDGDGNVDYVAAGVSWNAATQEGFDGPWWWVWRGDGAGHFSPSPGNGLPYMFWAPFQSNGEPAFIATHDNTHIGQLDPLDPEPVDRYSRQRSGVLDLNGDGILDYLRKVDVVGSPQLRAYFGNGLWLDGFQWSGHLATNGGVLQRSHVLAAETIDDGKFVTDGERHFEVRLLDYDGDGRQDLVDLDETAATSTVRLNTGSRFLEARPLTGQVRFHAAARQEVQVYDTGIAGMGGDYIWETLSDYVDLDGDSLPEWISFDGIEMNRAFNEVVDGKAPRLLWKVENGRGHTTTAKYTAMSDRSVVAVDSAAGKVSPASGWVVKSLTSHDAFESSDSTVTYAYRYPHYGPDNRNHWSMRGFEEVITTGASGAKTTEHFGYDVDWSGRKTKVVVSSAEAPTKAHSISATTWGKKTLFAGQVEIIVETDVHAYVCDNGQTTAQCEASPALMTREVPTWTKLQSTTAPNGHQLVWVQTERTMQDAQVYGDDDRRAVTTYALASDATTYRLREVETATFWNNLGADQLATRTTTGWDATYRYPVTKAVASTSNPADDLVTHTTYDSLTGNVLAVRKPQQYAASGVAAPATTYQYDVRKLFVVTTTNELGHVVDTVTEYGTGEVLFTKGPNVRQCTVNCTGPMKEEHNIARDALGRPLEEEEVTSPNGGQYTLWKVATHTYVDAPSGTISPHVIDRTLIDYVEGPSARWTETRTDVDGLGRPIRSTVEVDVADAPNDAVTTYDYDHRGKLVAVTVPDPSQNGTQTVTFTYEFDSLGRPTSMRRPDAATLAHRSGVDISYGPSSETRTEVPGIAGGPAASTETERDAFGRMIAVSEQTGVGTSATTSYSFGPSGQVSLIEDPDGVVTAMEHDLAGRRTSITRGGRTWVYGYDRNGNMISERVPTVDQNASTLAKYTTLHAYDALDREITRSVAPREWDIQADRDYFGIGTWTMTYDVGGIGGNGNKKGLLTSATAPGGVYTHQVTYDAQSNVTKDRRSFAMGGVSGTREWDATYLPGGKIDGFTYDDDATQAGNGARTKTKTYYDSRGLPEKVMWLRSDAGAWSVQLARHTRNVAGLVTKRWAPGGVPIAGQPSYPAMNAAYGYDAIGRLTSQVVTSGSTGSGGTQLARQDVAYWGSDDPKTLEHRLWPTGGAAVYKKFEYGYDLRHQLASVGEVAAGGAYAAAMEYSNAGRIGRATIGGAAPPATTEVRARDVTHVYGNPVASPPEDQELLKALKVASGANVGADYATFEYDVVGNMTSRTLTALATGGAPETWTYEYDGEDQLRRVVGPGGAVEEYWYDEGGQRVAIKKRTGGVGGAFAGFRWMSGDVEVETNSTGSVVQKTFTNVSMGTPIARLENRGDTAAGSGGVFERQYHGLGSSTLASVDGVTGGSRVGFVYGAWGEVVEKVGAVGEVASHRRRWNDKYVDDVGGLAYYGARYYDSVALQWTQGDPLYRWKPDFAGGEPRRANLYVFSGQNPMRYLDPDGLDFLGGWVVAKDVLEATASLNEAAIRESQDEKAMARYADALYEALKRSVGEFGGKGSAGIAIEGMVVSTAEDIKTLFDEDASLWEKVKAGASLAITFIPVGKIGTAAKGAVWGASKYGGRVVLGSIAALRAARARKAANLPAWEKVVVDMVHIMERHSEGGVLAAKRSFFPSPMNETAIMKAIRDAYKSSTIVHSTTQSGQKKLVMQGDGAGLRDPLVSAA